jgi:hypothetical protein
LVVLWRIVVLAETVIVEMGVEVVIVSKDVPGGRGC